MFVFKYVNVAIPKSLDRTYVMAFILRKSANARSFPTVQENMNSLVARCRTRWFAEGTGKNDNSFVRVVELMLQGLIEYYLLKPERPYEDNKFILHGIRQALLSSRLLERETMQLSIRVVET